MVGSRRRDSPRTARGASHCSLLKIVERLPRPLLVRPNHEPLGRDVVPGHGRRELAFDLLADQIDARRFVEAHQGRDEHLPLVRQQPRGPAGLATPARSQPDSASMAICKGPSGKAGHAKREPHRVRAQPHPFERDRRELASSGSRRTIPETRARRSGGSTVPRVRGPASAYARPASFRRRGRGVRRGGAWRSVSAACPSGSPVSAVGACFRRAQPIITERSSRRRLAA